MREEDAEKRADEIRAVIRRDVEHEVVQVIIGRDLRCYGGGSSSGKSKAHPTMTRRHWHIPCLVVMSLYNLWAGYFGGGEMTAFAFAFALTGLAREDGRRCDVHVPHQLLHA